MKISLFGGEDELNYFLYDTIILMEKYELSQYSLSSISNNVCNHDGICDPRETINNCPSDCGSEFRHNTSRLRQRNFSIEIGGSRSLNNSYKRNKRIKILYKNKSLIQINHNFSKRRLDLRNLSIIKNISENKAYLMIKGVNATETKTIYLNKNQSSSNAVCILDEEINNLTSLKNNCHKFNCPGSYNSIKV